VKIYTPALVVRDFLSAGMVTTRGYGDLGTDGTDLVWIEAGVETTETVPFDSYTIMTSPITTDPAQVVPRRLRTEQGLASISSISTWAAVSPPAPAAVLPCAADGGTE
jgi:hypothetical protein